MDSTYLVEACEIISIGSIKRDRRFKLEDDDTYVVFDSGKEHLPQRIALTQQAITYGIRHYFECNCGMRTNKLYQPPGKSEYRCRRCYRLRYEVTTINRTSKHGVFLYRANRTNKLLKQREGINRLLYKGKYTKRIDRFLKLCGRVGLNSMVNGARDAMTAIASQ